MKKNRLVSTTGAAGSVKVPFASKAIPSEALFATAIIRANGVDAVRVIGAVVTAFALIDVLALRNRQGGFEAVLTLARVRSHRVDALAPRGTMIRAETTFVHVVARGPVAFKPGIAHALRVISGQTSGVRMTYESVAMRTAKSRCVHGASATSPISNATCAIPVAFGTAGPRRGHVAVAVDLVALSFRNRTHEDAGAAEVAEAPVFADFERRLRGAHVAHARPRFT